MIHEAVDRVEHQDLEDASIVPGDVAVTAADRGISAQARSMQDLDQMLDEVARRDNRRGGGLLDIGCEVGGALKNVIAIATGIAQGLGVGDNTRAMVITRGLAEITRLGEAMGADPRTFSGLTGLGDLMATCMSPLSRNRRVGEELAKGKTIDEVVEEMHQVAEGVKSARTVVELAAEYGVPMPIAEEVDAVVNEGLHPREAYRGLGRVAAAHERHEVA